MNKEAMSRTQHIFVDFENVHEVDLDLAAGSGKTYIRLFRQARQLGYEIELHYLWLSSPAQAIARVRQRVRQGGHHVPAADIRRSLSHLCDDYLPLASRWAVWDSRGLPAKRLAISAIHDTDSVRALIGA